MRSDTPKNLFTLKNAMARNERRNGLFYIRMFYWFGDSMIVRVTLSAFFCFHVYFRNYFTGLW